MSANSSKPLPTSGLTSGDHNDLTTDLDLGFDGAEDIRSLDVAECGTIWTCVMAVPENLHQLDGCYPSASA